MSDADAASASARANASASSNPYAPPRGEAGVGTIAPAVTLAHGRLKYYFLVTTLLPVGFTIVAATVKDIGPAFAVLNLFLFVAAVGASLSWSHATWAFMPVRARGGVSPAAAVTHSFIPFYNFWWAFAFNLRIARSQQAIFRKYDTHTRAPVILAWVVPALSFGVIAILASVFAVASRQPAQAPVAPVPLWQMGASLFFMLLPALLTFAWMFRVDGCNTEILGLRALKRARKERHSSEDEGDDDEPARERMKAPRARKYERGR